MSAKPIHYFKTPELPGYNGRPIEVPDGLARRLRKNALDGKPVGVEFFESLDPALSKAIRDAASQVDGKAVEHARVLAPSGNLITKKRGYRRHVSVESHWLVDAVFVHNHPEGTPLSDKDLESLFDTELRSVWVVADGWLYGATHGAKGHGRSVLGDLRMAHAHLSEMASAVVADLLRHYPEIDEPSFETRHAHAVLSELAAAGYIRYCRVSHGP